MKKLIIVLMFFSLSGKAQLVLENTYSGYGKFILTEIAPNDFKYFLYDPNSNQFSLYNLNHSLYMTVIIPVTYVAGSSQYYVSFVSKSLFDCDSSNLEYAIMFLGNGGPAYPSPYFAVYHSNGTLLQQIDTVRYFNYSSGLSYGVLENIVPVVNTPAGTKLILSNTSGQAVIYSLCGSLPACAVENFGNAKELYNPYPNPSNNEVTLPYSIPEGETTGKLEIYDLSGQTIKEYNVDKTFSSLIINKSDLPSGTYLYSLKSSTTKSVAKKFIIIK